MTNPLHKTAVTYGIIGALIFIAIRTLVWIVDLQYYGSLLLGVAMLLSIYVLGILAQLKARSVNGGFMTFVEAVVVFIITVGIVIIGDFLINYLIFNVIDVEAQEVLKDISIQSVRSTMEMMGTPDNVIETETEKLIDAPSNFTLGKMVTGAAFSFLTYTILGLISAAIIKKKPVEEY